MKLRECKAPERGGRACRTTKKLEGTEKDRSVRDVILLSGFLAKSQEGKVDIKQDPMVTGRGRTNSQIKASAT